jgi:uncharacterized membrane protein
MLILILGLIVFLGAHTIPTLRPFRAALIARVGEGPYRGLYTLVSLLGIVLIVWGFGRYRAEGLIPVWSPPVWTRHVTILLMWFAFVSLACMNKTPGRIRGWLRHPLLAGVTIWALAHLIANGDAGGMLLFGAFLIWTVFARLSLMARGDFGAAPVAAFTRADGVALAVGTVAYVAMIALHPWLIGLRVV